MVKSVYSNIWSSQYILGEQSSQILWLWCYNNKKETIFETFNTSLKLRKYFTFCLWICVQLSIKWIKCLENRFSITAEGMYIFTLVKDRLMQFWHWNRFWSSFFFIYLISKMLGSCLFAWFYLRFSNLYRTCKIITQNDL